MERKNQPTNSPKLFKQGVVHKYKKFEAQKKAFYNYLQKHVATASMVTKATGIPQKNITRFKREYEKAGMLWQVVEKPCKATGFKAWWITTNFEYVKNYLETKNSVQNGQK